MRKVKHIIAMAALSAAVMVTSVPVMAAEVETEDFSAVIEGEPEEVGEVEMAEETEVPVLQDVSLEIVLEEFLECKVLVSKGKAEMVRAKKEDGTLRNIDDISKSSSGTYNSLYRGNYTISEIYVRDVSRDQASGALPFYYVFCRELPSGVEEGLMKYVTQAEGDYAHRAANYEYHLLPEKFCIEFTVTENKITINGSTDTPTDDTTPSDTTPSDTDESREPNEEQVKDFVTRLYEKILDRAPEETGLADWTNRLMTKEETAAQTARGIFFSEEFQNRNYSNEEFVEILYQAMFGRTGDEGGVQYWLSCLEKGASREYVYHGFAESPEFTVLCDSYEISRGNVSLGQYRDQNIEATGFIARLYTQMLGRSFDEEGIEYWCKAYLTGEKSIEDIAADGFLHSEEMKNQNLSNEEFVIRMYETFLNREPEEAGLNDWVGRLERGEETRDSLVYGFTNSREFGGLKAEYHLP